MASALRLHYCFLTALPLSLGSLTSLISSCLSLPFRTQERSANKKWGTQKGLYRDLLVFSPLSSFIFLSLEAKQVWDKKGNSFR